MSEQTARELIHRVRQGYDEADSFALTARVEAVLALCQRAHAESGTTSGVISSWEVERILDGVKL